MVSIKYVQGKKKAFVILSAARLATTRTSERTLSSGVLHHPSDPQYGQMLYVIDIPFPLSIGETVERTIIKTIEQEYFQTERKTAVYQFEDCIKSINLALAELAEDGNSDWVGHIHACIALWADGELYVTHAGRTVGMVARGGALASIIDSHASDRRVLVHKTFANLTSGQLALGDTIIFGNGEVNRHFSPQFLAQSLRETPLASIQMMFQTARRLNLRHITSIVARVEPESEEDMVPIETPVVLLETGATSNVVRELPQSVSRASGMAKQSWSKASSSLQTSFASASAYLQPKIKQGATSILKTIRSRKKPSVTFEDNDTEIPVSNVPGQSTDGPINIRPPALKRTHGQKIDHTLSRVWRYVKRIFDRGASYVRLAPPRLLLVGSIALVIVVAVSVRGKIHTGESGSSSSAQVQTETHAVTTLLDKAEKEAGTAPENARDTLLQAQNLITTLQHNGASRNIIASLQARYNRLLSQLNNVIVITPASTRDIQKNTVGIVVIGQYLFSATSSNGILYRQTLGNTEAAQVVYTAPSATIQYISVVDEERKIILGTSSGKLYRIDIDNNAAATELTPPTGESWPQIQSITTYQDNIYVLEKGTGQIWKYTSRDQAHYSTKQSYLASGSLATSSSTALASDGFIYMLTSDGSVTKLLKGAPQSFGPIHIPKPGSTIEAAAQIFTSASINSVYIQDKTRLIELTKDGQYARQYLLNEGSISHSFVSPKTKRLWLIVGNKLIESSL